MLKDKKWNKCIEDILIIFSFAIVIFTIIASRELNNFDEVWVFNTARNIANGLLPYKDFNLITTPGLPIICGIFLKTFCTEMFVMRILATILNTMIFYFIYKILKLIKINKWISLVITGILIYISKHYLCIDYNVTILFIALASLYTELKEYIEKKEIFSLNIKKEVLLGIFIGSSILMKQTTGLCLTIAFVGYKFLLVRNLEQLKMYLKILAVRGLAIIIPLLILLIYLLGNNILYDFIDYAILGIKEFTNKIPYSRLFQGNLALLAVLAPIVLITLIYIGFFKKYHLAVILFAYAISTSIVVYPISDNQHFLIAVTITLIAGVYLLNELYNKKLKDRINKKIEIFIEEFCKNIFIILSIALVLICFIEIRNLNLGKYTELMNFKYIPVSDDFKNDIKKVGKYIEESNKTVYIVEARAALYMIPINRYNKNYDLFLIGNMGSNAYDKITKDLKSKDNVELLLLKGRMNWQTPMNIIDYIKQNYRKTEEIGAFEIYSLNRREN